MSAEPLVRPDRRHRRREETIQQLLDVAVDLMGEQGAAGLSLGEIARRMDIRTPSLYGYFDSKNALYDALFERGWHDLGATLTALKDPSQDPAEIPVYALEFAQVFVRWAMDNPAYSQLLFWRPVPGYEPSPAAYAAAIEVLARGRAIMAMVQERGGLRPEVDVDEALRIWTVLIAGVVSQQLANAPGESFESGTFTATLPALVAMFLSHFGVQPALQTRPATTRKRSTRAVTSR